MTTLHDGNEPSFDDRAVSDPSGEGRPRFERLGLVDYVGRSPAGTPVWNETRFGRGVARLALRGDTTAIRFFDLVKSGEDGPGLERLGDALASVLGVPWPGVAPRATGSAMPPLESEVGRTLRSNGGALIEGLPVEARVVLAIEAARLEKLGLDPESVWSRGGPWLALATGGPAWGWD